MNFSAGKDLRLDDMVNKFSFLSSISSYNLHQKVIIFVQLRFFSPESQNITKYLLQKKCYFS